MTHARMKIIFKMRDDWPDDDAGIPAADLSATVRRMQDATLLMAAQLAGIDAPGSLPEWLRRQCALRVLSVSDEGKEATLGLPPFDDAAGVENYGAAALDAVLGWQGGNDAKLPRPVARQIDAIRNSLSSDVTGIGLWNVATGRRVSIESRDDQDGDTPAVRALPGASESDPEEVRLLGQLRDVDWEKGTAQLRPFTEEPVVLRFDADLMATMRRFVKHVVTVRGIGRIEADGRRGPVKVREIHSYTAAAREKLYAQKREPFDPERVRATALPPDDPTDIEEFIRVIYEARG